MCCVFRRELVRDGYSQVTPVAIFSDLATRLRYGVICTFMISHCTRQNQLGLRSITASNEKQKCGSYEQCT